MAAATPTPVVLAPTPVPATGARYGGVLTIVNPDPPTFFDMHQGTRIDMSIPFRNVYSALLRRDPLDTSKIIPELAEGWEVSPDGTTYTLRIRQGVRWHDGQPVTTEDVAYSLMRMAHPPKGVVSPRGQGLLEGLVTAEAAGPGAVRLKLEAPSSSFLSRVATDWVLVMPKHTIEKYGDMKQVVNGSGPFRFVRYNPGVSVELTKNKDYFVKERPYVDAIVVYIIPDAGTGFAALRSGRVLMSTIGSRALTEAQLRIVKAQLSDKITVEQYASFTRWILIPNMRVKPWQDVRVRRAVDLAVDRQAYLKLSQLNIVGGYFHPNTKWGVPTQDLLKQPGFRPDKAQDLAEAKRLMAEAGYAGGLDVPVTCRRGTDCEVYAPVLKTQLAQIGINATLVPYEAVVLVQRFEKGDFSLALYGAGVVLDDPDAILFEQYVSNGARNYGKFVDKDVDAWAKEQSRILNEQQRLEIVRKIDQRLTEQRALPTLFWVDYVRAYWKSVRGVRHGPGLWVDENMEYAWLSQ